MSKREPNAALGRLLTETGWTYSQFAASVNRLGAQAGLPLHARLIGRNFPLLFPRRAPTRRPRDVRPRHRVTVSVRVNACALRNRTGTQSGTGTTPR